MATLLESLPLPEQREAIVDDCCDLLDAEVKKKGGMSGLAVKAGYKVLKSLKAGAVRSAVDGLLDDFIAALEPFHDEYQGGSGTFGAHLKAHDARVGEALVQVTDQKAEHSKHKTLARGYKRLRPSAMRNVVAAVPGLADLFDKYYQA